MSTGDAAMKGQADPLFWVMYENHGVSLYWHLWTFNVQFFNVVAGIKLHCKM